MITTGVLLFVEVGSKPVRFNGHCNLLDFEYLIKPVSIQRFHKKSVFSRKKLVEAQFSIATSGFILGESIPFGFSFINPKTYPLNISVRVMQNLKYNATNNSTSTKRSFKIVAVANRTENNPLPESFWVDDLVIPQNQPHTFTEHFMINVTYTIQFMVKIMDDTVGDAVIKGEAPIYIGTTREDVESLRTGGRMENLDVPSNDSRRRGSDSSLNTLESSSSRSRLRTSNLPPAYSMLSLRTPSWETLPPSYDELEFEELPPEYTLEDFTLQVPLTSDQLRSSSVSEEEDAHVSLLNE
ncbi:unnamed protein product [Orchesella dallaii]|uniref:Arrestin C-terminal-like domain-containing protein n=1 Tax=Orchesella dallaii TaxID=48710 RepID=A0ABP1QRN2_9HEXA